VNFYILVSLHVCTWLSVTLDDTVFEGVDQGLGPKLRPTGKPRYTDISANA
jgi:hypothetical protein